MSLPGHSVNSFVSSVALWLWERRVATSTLWVSDHLSHCRVCGVIPCGSVTICHIAVFVV